MTKIKCVICGKEMINPSPRRKTCSRKCATEYRKVYQQTDEYREYHRLRHKEYNKLHRRGKSSKHKCLGILPNFI